MVYCTSSQHVNHSLPLNTIDLTLNGSSYHYYTKRAAHKQIHSIASREILYWKLHSCVKRHLSAKVASELLRERAIDSVVVQVRCADDRAGYPGRGLSFALETNSPFQMTNSTEAR